MTLWAAAERDFGRENRQTLSPGCLTPYSIVLGPYGVGVVICKSSLVYVADRPCSVRGETPNRLECRSTSLKTNAVSSIDVWGIGNFPCAMGYIC